MKSLNVRCMPFSNSVFYAQPMAVVFNISMTHTTSYTPIIQIEIGISIQLCNTITKISTNNRDLSFNNEPS